MVIIVIRNYYNLLLTMINKLFRFDPWSLLNALRNKAKSLGTFYVEGEVVNFGFKVDTSVSVEDDPNKEYEGINSVKVRKSIT